MPGNGAKDAETDLPEQGDHVRRITNVSCPTLTVFPAAKRNPSAPAIIVCPGGGYGYVVYDKEGTDIAAWLNSVGITALVLKYRTPHNRDGALQDLQRALSLARTNAAAWNVDPKRLGVMGFSAGGHIAARASTQFDNRAYAGVDGVDSQSCRPDFAVLVYPAYLSKDGQAAPELNLKVNLPPTLIVHSDDDRTHIAGTRIYVAASREVRAPLELILYPTGGHGYGLRCTGEARAWPQAALEWLKKNGVE